jgi:hypothetical protein
MEPCLLKVKSILHEYNEQFKAVGGGEFKIPFMADNIGGFKINGTVGWATIGLVRRRCPTPVLGTPSTEILIQQ